MSRQDQYDTRVTVIESDDSREDLGIFAKLTGGDLDSSETKFPPGAMAPEVALGGTPSTDNITLSRLFVQGRDDEFIAKYGNRRGKVRVAVKKQPLDIDGHANGRALNYSGTLKRIGPPDYDSESDNAALLELEISADALVA